MNSLTETLPVSPQLKALYLLNFKQAYLKFFTWVWMDYMCRLGPLGPLLWGVMTKEGWLARAIAKLSGLFFVHLTFII